MQCPNIIFFKKSISETPSRMSLNSLQMPIPLPILVNHSIFNGLQGMVLVLVLVLVVAMVLAFVNYSNTASYKHHLSRCLQGLSHGKTMNKERLAQSLQGSLQPLKVLRNSKTHIMERYVCYAIKLKLQVGGDCNVHLQIKNQHIVIVF